MFGFAVITAGVKQYGNTLMNDGYYVMIEIYCHLSLRLFGGLVSRKMARQKVKFSDFIIKRLVADKVVTVLSWRAVLFAALATVACAMFSNSWYHRRKWRA